MHLTKLLSVLLLGCLISVVTFAHETADCTSSARSEWKHLDDARNELTGRGYTIRKLKISGTCYELYGKDARGKKAEFFFDPVTLKLVETD